MWRKRSLECALFNKFKNPYTQKSQNERGQNNNTATIHGHINLCTSRLQVDHMFNLIPKYSPLPHT